MYAALSSESTSLVPDFDRISVTLMSISHELSSEIAAALFTSKERSPRELKNLKDMILKVHSTLEELARKDRTHRQASISDPVRSVPPVKSTKQ